MVRPVSACRRSLINIRRLHARLRSVIYTVSAAVNAHFEQYHSNAAAVLALRRKSGHVRDALVHAGKKVVVLEGRMRGAGQSGKDTGELLAWNNHSLSTLHDSYGQKVVSAVAQSHLDAIKTVHGIISQEAIPCQFTPVSGYIQASERKLAAELRTVQSTFSAAQQVSVCQALSTNPAFCTLQLLTPPAQS